MTKYATIVGTGSALPIARVSNTALPASLETSDEWIRSRTGIGNRYIASDAEGCISLGTKAAEQALIMARTLPEEVDLVICATATNDFIFPAAACVIAANLGITQKPAFDMQAACSGFIYALSVADSMIKSGSAKCALVIGSEIMSRVVDWHDRSTCVLFGDGAGAVLLKASDTPGIIDCNISADGTAPEILFAPAAYNPNFNFSHVAMQGKAVFKEAVNKLGDILLSTLERNHLTSAHIDWFIPHQANQRIIQSMAEKLNLPAEKVILTIEDHSNTSSASIPLALDHAVRKGTIKKGDLLLLQAFGAGLTWGASLVRF